MKKITDKTYRQIGDYWGSWFYKQLGYRITEDADDSIALGKTMEELKKKLKD